MKIYTLIEVSYDWYSFEDVESVGVNLQKLIDNRTHKTRDVFSEIEYLDEDFDADGNTHYYWKEWEV